MLSVLDKVSAGWNSKAWPSTNNYRFTDTNDYVQVTNLYAKRFFISISVSNELFGTNYVYPTIPEWTSTGYVYRVVHKTNLFNEKYGDWYYATSLWNAVGVLGLTDSNYFQLNDVTEYLTDIQVGATNLLSYASTNVVTNTYWAFNNGDYIYAWGDFDPFPSWDTNLWATKSNKITEIQQVIGDGIQTNLSLNVKDLRAWDVFNALVERTKVVGEQHESAGEIKARFYREERDNLVGFKEYIGKKTYIADPWLIRFVDVSKASNDNFQAYLIPRTNDSSGIPFYSVTSLLSFIEAPTNYFDYTPWRSLSGAGIGVGHYVTSYFTIVASPGEIVTNDVKDYVGTNHVIIGTNGQEFSFIATNTSVLEGFSTLDYGWKYMDSIINSLVWTKSTVSGWNNYPGDTNYYNRSGGGDPIFTQACANVESSSQEGLPPSIDEGPICAYYGYRSPYSPFNYYMDQSVIFNFGLYQAAATTNISTYEATHYIYCDVGDVGDRLSTYDIIFDSYGFNVASNAWTFELQPVTNVLTSVVAYTTSIFSNRTNALLDRPNKPSGYNYYSVRGWSIQEPSVFPADPRSKVEVLLKWNISNGFEYVGN